MTAEEEEIAQLKKELAAERAKTSGLEGELSRERAEIVSLRQMVGEVLRRLGEVEGQLAKDSNNSNKPSSSDGLGRKRVSLHWLRPLLASLCPSLGHLCSYHNHFIPKRPIQRR